MANNQQHRQPLPGAREKNTGSRKPWKGFAVALFAIFGFSLASQLIIFNSPKTVSTLDIPALTRKLEDIKQQGSHYDFVFLGSSRVFRGINPLEIDAEAGRLGCNIRTYNFGIAGLSILEQKYVLDKLYATGIGIETIIVEPYSVTIRELDNFLSDRRRFFYTWDNLAELVLDQNTMPDNSKPKKRRERLAFLLYGFMREQSGIGRLSNLLFPQQQKAGGIWDSPIRRGYRPLDEESAKNFTKRKKQFVRRAVKFEDEIAKATNNPAARKSSGDRFELVLGVADKIRAMEIKPAILLMPKPAHITHSNDLEERLVNETPSPLPIINLNRPDYYGDLFKASNFFDGSHLNSRGAIRLARHLAPRLCAMQTGN